ncbi:MAG TPA: hypothetical protein DCG75_08330 [Bacteroidales bacterium]|nr:hypothetical protein [Bacteroidales bacterium]
MAELKKVPIPIDEKLAHLSASEVQNIFDAYHFTNQKAKDIISEYKLTGVPLGGLRFILKYKENSDNCCPIHNTISWQKAKGRNVWGIPFCPICNMKVWETLPLNFYNRKPKIINPKPMKNLYVKSEVTLLDLEKYQTLDFSVKVLIVCWFNADKKKKSKNLSFYTLDVTKIFPNPIMKAAYKDKLEESFLVLGNKYFLQKINLSEELTDCFENTNYLIEADSKEMFNLWWDIAYHEILEYLLFELNKKNLIVQIDERIEEVIHFMIGGLSVQQCMFATWAAIKDSCSLIAEKNWDLDYAACVIPEQLKKKAIRIIEGSLNKFPFNRPYPCAQSKFAKLFYEDITFLGEEGFTECPNIEYFYTVGSPKGPIKTSNNSKNIHVSIKDDDNKSIGDILRENKYFNNFKSGTKNQDFSFD